MRFFSRTLFAAVLSVTSAAFAHFPFIVPNADGTAASLIMSETLVPDSEVKIELLSNIKLSLTDIAGKSSELSATPVAAEHRMTLALPGDGVRIVHGTADLGIMQRGDKPPHWLVYYPKTILGDAFDARATLGKDTPVELVPVKTDKGIAIKLLVDNQPAGNRDIRIITPDGIEADYTTDATGVTETLTQTGRYGAWARNWGDTKGDINGKPYEQLREYATLVFDAPAADAPKATTAAPAQDATAAAADATNPTAATVTPFATLPESVASFGAVANDGWLYVYGGHTAERHEYSTASVSGRFHRVKFSEPTKWESLPAGPAVQGMNLAAYDGKIYRVGGMQPRNAPGEPADNYSLTEAARFDPTANAWQPLPPLPTPRSSHDIAIVDGVLYVIGGWNMQGQDAENVWLESIDTLDLKDPNASWKTIPQPFSRRAMIVATHGSQIFVMGGFDSDDKAQLDVDVYDTKTLQWTKGPQIPGEQRNGFSPAACTVDGDVYLSVGTGDLYKLSDKGDAWTGVAKAAPRIVHRLVPNGDGLLIVGGASGRKMTKEIDAVTFTPTASTPLSTTVAPQ